MRWCVVKCSTIFTGKAIRHFRGRISDHIGTIFISQVKKYKWVAIRQSDSKTLLSLPLLLITVWKVSKYGLISCPYFPVFGLNTERYEVSLRIQSECGKIRTRNNSVFGRFTQCFAHVLNGWFLSDNLIYQGFYLVSNI